MKIFLLCFLFPLQFAIMEGFTEEFVIWNVGQGQWATWITAEDCHHFDMGGEFAPLNKIESLCQGKRNHLYLSHWDYDHVSFIQSFRRRIPSLCFAGFPTASGRKRILQLKTEEALCGRSGSSVRELFSGGGKTQNSASRVFTLKDQVLIPGDSPRAEEKKWRHQLSPGLKGIILGHHGSNTSTSKELLDKLPSLKWSVASARKKRYGHPHLQVLARLADKKVPVLSTEDWGHIRFLLK